MKKNYKVTIAIPVYNGSNYVGEAIQSAIKQTYENLEILVINDGSTDEGLTKKAVEPFLSDKRITYIEKENGGVSSALNYAIEHFSGDFLAWLSHDDLIKPESIESKLLMWEKLGSSEKYIISTKTIYINGEGKKIFRAASKSKDVNNVYDILSSTINGCSLLIPSEAIKKYRFDEKMIYMQDYYVWANMIEDGYRIRLLKKKLTYNRIHKKQVTVNRFDSLVKDFNSFAVSYIDPLMEKNDYKQLKKIIYCFTRRFSVRPFYQEYRDRYLNYLKEKKKWNIFNSIHLFFDSMVSFAVKLLRKL